MLAWEIFVHRQIPGELLDEPAEDTLLAHWIVALDGADWLDQLAKERRATILYANGYPYRYIALARDVLARIPYDSQDPRTSINRERIAECSPDELLIVDAWDQS